MEKVNRLTAITEENVKSIGDRCGTDKTLIHGYHRFYPIHLSHLRRFRKFGIIEIGYGEGYSIPFWQSLFRGAHIYCLDRDVETDGSDFSVIKTDQSSTDSLESALLRVTHPLRLVIDDGSHKPSHQLLTFSTIFPRMCEDGIYIVEDIETSYWLNGSIYGYETRYGLFNQWSAIEAFKLAADYVNRCFLPGCDRSLIEYRLALAGISPEAAALISSVTFAQNCIILKKARIADLKFTEREYLFHQDKILREP